MFSKLNYPLCSEGMVVGLSSECVEAMRLYMGPEAPLNMMKIIENDPTHPPGCHVMHATGEWHFNEAYYPPKGPKAFDPNLFVRGVHLVCKVNNRKE